jgi:hypothetical protein
MQQICRADAAREVDLASNVPDPSIFVSLPTPACPSPWRRATSCQKLGIVDPPDPPFLYRLSLFDIRFSRA